MNPVRIEPANTPEARRAFVDAAWTAQAANPLWVPPLKRQDEELLTPGRHPFWEQAEGQLFLATRGGRAVGRIAAIVDHAYNTYARTRCGAWGFFECLDDREAAFALFDAAAGWCRQQGMAYVRGPLNPSTNYTCGMLVQGFARPPSIMMPWNPEYYPGFAEAWGMRKEQDLYAYHFERSCMDTTPDWLRRELDALADRGEFTCRTSSKATLAEDIRTMLDIYGKSWAENWGFTPMSLAEAERHIHELKSVLDPKFFVLFHHQGTPVAGMLALQDMNPLLKRLNGSMGLAAPWHYWRARNAMRGHYRLLLFGILPEYRMRGLPLLLLDFLFETARKDPQFLTLEGSWSLESNDLINGVIEDFGGVMSKRYRIYRRELEE